MSCPSDDDAQSSSSVDFRTGFAVGQTPAGVGRVPLSAQRRTQRRPRPRSPQTVGRWSSEGPKTANITRRRPMGKVLLLRTGFHAIDRYRHRRPVLVLPRRRPQVDTQHLPPILRVSKPLAVERVLTHSRPWLPQGRSTGEFSRCAQFVRPPPAELGRSSRASSPGISPNKQLVRAGP